MKNFRTLFLLTLFSLVSNTSNACSPLGVPILNNQTVNGTNLELNWTSTTGWSCSYNIITEIYCTNPVSGAPLITNQSGCINKGNSGNIAYAAPQIIDVSALCPGETYYFRGKETSCGNSFGGFWTQVFSFVYGTAGVFQVTSNATATNICQGSCVDLTAIGANNCQPGITYSWDNGGGAGSTVNVCPPTTTTYTVTASTVGVCATLTATDNITIVVDLPPIAGTALATPDSICLGGTANLSLAGYNGNLQWQSAASSTGPWTNITGANLDTYTTAPINATMYYQVEVSNACGSVFSNVITVEPVPFPLVNFSMNDECLNIATTFTDNTSITSGLITTWTWDFGDGNVSSLQNPTNLYAAPGNYNVSLTTTSFYGCSSTITLPTIIHSLPVANFSSDVVCANSPTTFTDLSTVLNSTVTVWNWDILNDNSVEYVSQNPTNIFSFGGTYLVELEVESAFGCKDSIVNPVDVEYTPIPNFTADTVCLGLPSTLTDASNVTNSTITNWNWTFGDGNTGSGTPATNTYPNSGNYTAQLDITSALGCTASITGPVYVRQLPAPNFSAFDACFYDDVLTNNLSTLDIGTMSYAWDFGDGSVAHTNQNESHGYSVEGIYLITLTVTSSFNCIDSVTIPVNVYEAPTALFTSDETQICNPDVINYTDLSSSNSTTISSLEWDFYNGTTSTDQNPTVTYYNAGGTPILFDVQLIATNSFGCKDTVLVTDYIQVIPTPIAAFTFDPYNPDILDPEVEFTNNSIYADEYSWDFGDLSASSTIENPTHLYPVTPASYLVELIAYNYGKFCSDTAIAIVNILDVVIFYVPNIFTPDGDEFNETWNPIFTSGYDPFDYHLTIFNRWGEIIWESYNASVGWNGHYGDGGLVQDGAYVWQIDFKETMSDKRHMERGTVTVMK
jgi:gliding motility-associated-like protein